MSDARDEKDARDPGGPLGLAARLRRETPVQAAPVVPEPEVDDPFGDDTPAPRVPLRELLRTRASAVDLLLFRVGGDLFATDLLAVEEALELDDVHPVPGAPPAMLGVLALRGRLVPVYSPERALAQPVRRAAEGAYVLVLRAPAEGARPVAIVVDDVEDVHAADLAGAQDVVGVATGEGAHDGEGARARGASGGTAHDVVLGVLHWNGRLVALVDTDALIAACAADEGAAVREPTRDVPEETP